MNKLASIEYISEIRPHPNADRLELAKVLGFQCVVQKGQYKKGDLIVYVQPDTILPDSKWAEPYKKYAPNRIKAIRLRGEISNGLIVNPQDVFLHKIQPDHVGDEVSEHIAVRKWEAPLVDLGRSKQGLPFGLTKTDEERWENLDSQDIPWHELCDVTLKIDGTSFTAAYRLEDDKFCVCSRTCTILDPYQSRFANILNKYEIESKLKDYCIQHSLSLAIRGEMYGAGIQSHKNNPHAKLPNDFALFDVVNLDTLQSYSPGSYNCFACFADRVGLPTVPILEKEVVLTPQLIEFYQNGTKHLADTMFEGVVIKHNSGSFKVINSYYDSKK